MDYIDALSELEDFGDGNPWCDLVFDVVEHRVVARAGNGRSVSWIEGRALADMRGEVIGFGFEIPLATWHASRSDNPEFHWSRINLVSLVGVTDALIGGYATWFDLSAMNRPAASRFECGAVALEGGPPDPLQRRTRFKLFFEARDDQASQAPGGEESSQDLGYAELFFNIDLGAKRTWLHEKDPDYRLPLLRFLTGDLVTEPSIHLMRPQ